MEMIRLKLNLKRTTRERAHLVIRLNDISASVTWPGSRLSKVKARTWQTDTHTDIRHRSHCHDAFASGNDW